MPNRYLLIIVYTSIHCISYCVEGTRQYEKLREEIFRIALDENAPDYVKQRVGDMEKRMEGLWKDYADQMKDMSREERLYLIDTERNSQLLEDLLAEQYFIDKLAERNAPLVKKLISQFKGTIKKSTSTPPQGVLDSESIKYLKKLVNKFENALDNAQSGVKISQIGNDDEEREFVNVRYSKSNEKSSIREQLKSSIDIINEMQPVAVVNSKNMTKKEVFDFAIEEFKKFGYQVERQNFGKIEIGKKEINDSLNYLNQEGEILALLSVPKVLKRGTLIDGHSNHKGRNYETVTIAAPVVINGVRGNVGVIVKQGGKNKYKTHRILMPDGSEFVFETKNDAESTSAGVKGENHRQGPAINSTSNNIISENSEKNNTFNENNSKNVSDERKSVKRSYEPGDIAKLKYGKDDLKDKGLIRNFDHRDIVVKEIEKHLDKNIKIDHFDIELSKGMGSFETFYVNIALDEYGDNSFTVRFSGHNGYGGSADYYLWNDDYKNVSDLLNSIDKIINENGDIRYSKQRSYEPGKESEFEETLRSKYDSAEQEEINENQKVKKKSQYTTAKGTVRNLLKDVFGAYVTVENIDDDFAFVSRETKMIIARDNVEQIGSFYILPNVKLPSKYITK